MIFQETIEGMRCWTKTEKARFVDAGGELQTKFIAWFTRTDDPAFVHDFRHVPDGIGRPEFFDNEDDAHQAAVEDLTDAINSVTQNAQTRKRK